MSPPPPHTHTAHESRTGGRLIKPGVELFQGNCLTIPHPGLGHTGQVYSLLWQIILQNRGLIINRSGSAQHQCQARIKIPSPTTDISQMGQRLEGNLACLYLALNSTPFTIIALSDAAFSISLCSSLTFIPDWQNIWEIQDFPSKHRFLQNLVSKEKMTSYAGNPWSEPPTF